MKQILLVFMLFCLPRLIAQQATVATGGNSTGAGGSATYSIGQVAYKAQIGTTGTLTQGAQQPYEISTLSGSEFTNITLEALVYPNPTTSFVKLSIKNSAIENLRYQLFDLRGRVLSVAKILNAETVIEMESYPSATYLLKVNSNNKELKTFKIIKN